MFLVFIMYTHSKPMARFMLSFERGTPIALALDKKGGVVHTVHITPDSELPDIDVDNPLELIDDIDIKAAKKDMKLGTIDTRILTNAIKLKDSSKLSEGLKRAFDVLESKAHKKLKGEIHFDGKDVSSVIPLIGNGAYDRSILLVGPSGSGKSYLAKQIIRHDKRKRPIALYSKVRDDPSLRDLQNQMIPKTVASGLLRPGSGLVEPIVSTEMVSRLNSIPIYSDDDLVCLPTDSDLENVITLFDDIDAFTGERANYLRGYRDAILEAGRHKNITVLSTSHILSNYNKTRTMLNEAEYVVLFPNANRRSADMFLKDRMGMSKSDRDHLIRRAGSTGRYMIIRMSCPNLMIHSQGILLI